MDFAGFSTIKTTASAPSLQADQGGLGSPGVGFRPIGQVEAKRAPPSCNVPQVIAGKPSTVGVPEHYLLGFAGPAAWFQQLLSTKKTKRANSFRTIDLADFWDVKKPRHLLHHYKASTLSHFLNLHLSC